LDVGGQAQHHFEDAVFDLAAAGVDAEVDLRVVLAAEDFRALRSFEGSVLDIDALQAEASVGSRGLGCCWLGCCLVLVVVCHVLTCSVRLLLLWIELPARCYLPPLLTTGRLEARHSPMPPCSRLTWVKPAFCRSFTAS